MTQLGELIQWDMPAEVRRWSRWELAFIFLKPIPSAIFSCSCMALVVIVYLKVIFPTVELPSLQEAIDIALLPSILILLMLATPTYILLTDTKSSYIVDWDGIQLNTTSEESTLITYKNIASYSDIRSSNNPKGSFILIEKSCLSEKNENIHFLKSGFQTLKQEKQYFKG